MNSGYPSDSPDALQAFEQERKDSMREKLHIHTGFRTYLEKTHGKEMGQMLKECKIVPMKILPRITKLPKGSLDL